MLILNGHRFVLPSGRYVRVVSTQGSTFTCVYTTEDGREIAGAEAAVSLQGRFLLGWAKPVGELVAEA